jgi:hypothetical protein
MGSRDNFLVSVADLRLEQSWVLWMSASGHEDVPSNNMAVVNANGFLCINK